MLKSQREKMTGKLIANLSTSAPDFENAVIDIRKMDDQELIKSYNRLNSGKMFFAAHEFSLQS